MILGALLGLALCVTVGQAEEVKGKVKKIDADKFTITVSVDGQEKTYDVDRSAFVLSGEGRNFRGGFKALKDGLEVTLTTSKKEDKEIVGVIKVTVAKKKK
jgi:hypothetical protein